MFDILNLLPASDQWFEISCHSERSEESVFANVCTKSGYLAGPECPETEEMVLPSACLQSDPCPYHRNGEFVLPPAMEWFYKPHHPEYVGARRKTASDQAMEFIYPGSGTVLYLPRQLSGEVEGVVFRVAHHSSDATLWWHLDQSFVGETRFIHELRLAPPVGRHTLTVVDGDGNSASIVFTVAE